MDDNDKTVIGKNSLLEAAELSEMGGSFDVPVSDVPPTDSHSDKSTLLEAAAESEAEGELANIRRQLAATQRDLDAALEENAQLARESEVPAEQSVTLDKEQGAQLISQQAQISELEESLAASQAMVSRLTTETKELHDQMELLKTELHNEKCLRHTTHEELLDKQKQRPSVEEVEEAEPTDSASQEQQTPEILASQKDGKTEASKAPVMPERLLEKWIESD